MNAEAEYLYHVAYSHERGNGMAFLPMYHPITTQRHVMDIRHWLMDNANVHNPVVITFHLLSSPAGDGDRVALKNTYDRIGHALACAEGGTADVDDRFAKLIDALHSLRKRIRKDCDIDA